MTKYHSDHQINSEKVDTYERQWWEGLHGFRRRQGCPKVRRQYMAENEEGYWRFGWKYMDFVLQLLESSFGGFINTLFNLTPKFLSPLRRRSMKTPKKMIHNWSNLFQWSPNFKWSIGQPWPAQFMIIIIFIMMNTMILIVVIMTTISLI